MHPGICIGVIHDQAVRVKCIGVIHDQAVRVKCIGVINDQAVRVKCSAKATWFLILVYYSQGKNA